MFKTVALGMVSFLLAGLGFLPWALSLADTLFCLVVQGQAFFVHREFMIGMAVPALIGGPKIYLAVRYGFNDTRGTALGQWALFTDWLGRRFTFVKCLFVFMFIGIVGPIVLLVGHFQWWGVPYETNWNFFMVLLPMLIMIVDSMSLTAIEEAQRLERLRAG